jgi:hypothetical protein
MSHIVEARTKIQNPDQALLRQTLDIVAGTHEGGHVEDHILDFGGRQQPVSTGLSVFTGQVHRGIGIEITSDGTLIFKGDPWRVQDAFTLLQQEIVQTYVSLATMQALQAMGYTADASQEDAQIVIRGVAYA